MTAIELKTKVHQRIEHLTEEQLAELDQMIEQKFSIVPSPPLKERKLGTMPGLIKYMASDFDEPLEDFKEYMPDRHSDL